MAKRWKRDALHDLPLFENSKGNTSTTESTPEPERQGPASPSSLTSDFLRSRIKNALCGYAEAGCTFADLCEYLGRVDRRIMRARLDDLVDAGEVEHRADVEPSRYIVREVSSDE